MKKKWQKLTAILAVLALAIGLCGGCGEIGYEERKSYTREEALEELVAKLKPINVETVKAPLDIYDSEVATQSLADIKTFPITVSGNGKINIEIAAATELSSEAPDDLINVWAKNFNKAGVTVNGKSASVSVRKITSGEILTYMTDGDYRPDVYVPSSEAWGKMLEARGIETAQLTDHLVGNTAGILMEKQVHTDFTSKYGEVTLDKILEASLAGDLTFAYTNPYTSSTGLNILAGMLHGFDQQNPLSKQAEQKLLEYQRQSPPVAYTTAVLKTQATKGIINAMVMEEQAYTNAPELKDYVYTPAGMRHDHPVYTFEYVSVEKQEVARKFVEYCLSNEAQKIADSKGFNLHDDYKSQDPGLDGAGYLAAQRVWKLNKDGGRPVITVFVTDISGSMDGTPLNELKKSLIETSQYIASNNYVGLVSYSDDVYINLDFMQYNEDTDSYDMLPFDEMQRAYFSGAVKSLSASGGTATYDATLVALDMLRKGAEQIPDAKLMLFVLSDGARNQGYRMSQIVDIVDGLDIPIYTIGYNVSDTDELQQLSDVNEAALINTNTDGIIKELRDLFNVNL